MAFYSFLTSLSTTELLVATAVSIAGYLFIQYFTRRKNLPPGPMGLPVVGYLPYLGKMPFLKFQELAKTYGDVFSLHLGSRFVVVLSGADAVKEGMNKSEFTGRPPESSFHIGENYPNIVTLSGKDLVEQRRFTLQSMRDLGFGKSVMEECMKVELEYFIRTLEESKGKAFDLRSVLSASVSNNITALIFGTRYDYEDPRRKLLDDTRNVIQEFLGQTALHTFLPWIVKLPFMKRFMKYDDADKMTRLSNKFARERLAEHKKTLDANNARDYIDKYLIEIDEIKRKKTDATSFSNDMLLGNVGALMGAGSETMITTLGWCMYIMAAYPEVQRKVQAEISNVVGSERLPAWVDQKLMPYTQAVIMEIMRWKTIIPLNLLRYTFEDTKFRGYDIPKGTIIMADLWSAHMDSRYWKEPEKFLPDRFLSPDGQTIVKSEAYMPFSVGKRSCPGETMAVVETFIYFTTILQRFEISLPKGDVPDLNGVLTISYQTKPHKLCFTSRVSK